MIEKSTILFALIGDNLAYDKRPQLANYLYGLMDENCALIPMNIRPDDLAFTLKGLKKSQFSTIFLDRCYHETVFPYLDHYSPFSAATHLVDTITIRDGELYGDYTLIDDLFSTVCFEGKSLTLIGATPLALAFVQKVETLFLSSICCVTQTLEESSPLIEALPSSLPFSSDWFSSSRAIDVAQSEIIINTTSSKNLSFKGATEKNLFIDFSLTPLQEFSQGEIITGYDIAMRTFQNHYRNIFHKNPPMITDYRDVLTEDFTRECQLTKG